MIIKTENLKREFTVGSEKVEALKGIDLAVEKGDFIAIMGPSGSGKNNPYEYNWLSGHAIKRKLLFK